MTVSSIFECINIDFVTVNSKLRYWLSIHLFNGLSLFTNAKWLFFWIRLCGVCTIDLVCCFFRALQTFARKRDWINYRMNKCQHKHDEKRDTSADQFLRLSLDIWLWLKCHNLSKNKSMRNSNSINDWTRSNLTHKVI